MKKTREGNKRESLQCGTIAIMYTNYSTLNTKLPGGYKLVAIISTPTKG